MVKMWSYYIEFGVGSQDFAMQTKKALLWLLPKCVRASGLNELESIQRLGRDHLVRPGRQSRLLKFLMVYIMSFLLR